MFSVLEDVASFRLYKDNQIMIEVQKEDVETFYTYNLISNKLKKLDTESPLEHR